MLKDGIGFKKIVVCCGRVDMRKGIDGMAAVVRLNYKADPLEEGTLFLFCGRNRSKVKGLVWEGDGFTLISKRLTDGSYCFPRTPEEARTLSKEEFIRLMEGFSIDSTINK